MSDANMEDRVDELTDLLAFAEDERDEAKAEARTAYHERAELVAYLTRQYPWHWALDKKALEWPVVCVHSPAGQMTWHINKDDATLFTDHPHASHHFLTTVECVWDRHSTEEKYDRLRRL